jgi:hypothetical protein
MSASPSPSAPIVAVTPGHAEPFWWEKKKRRNDDEEVLLISANLWE